MDTLPNGNSASAAGTAPTTTAAALAAPAPSSKLTQLAESLKLEHQFLRVPFEHYKKTIRANHRIVEKEMSAVISGVSDAADGELSQDDAVQHLSSLVSRLQGLKRKRSRWVNQDTHGCPSTTPPDKSRDSNSRCLHGDQNPLTNVAEPPGPYN